MTESARALNEQEQSVWADRTFMPLKQQVWSKLEARLTEVLEELRSSYHPDMLPWPSHPGRMYKGENYLSYSYRSLDFPAYSAGNDLFLIRVVLLWGHPVGVHLICTGAPREFAEKKIWANQTTLADGWLLAAQDSPWIWEPRAGLLPLANMSEQIWQAENLRRTFLKISRYMPGPELDDLESFVLTSWKEIMASLE